MFWILLVLLGWRLWSSESCKVLSLDKATLHGLQQAAPFWAVNMAVLMSAPEPHVPEQQWGGWSPSMAGVQGVQSLRNATCSVYTLMGNYKCQPAAEV